MIGAFGNPLISDSPVSDSIYQSQADQYGNSFSAPINSANLNPGWGINPALLTPSYQAGYRPQYSGPQPTNQYGRRSVAQAAWALSPMSDDLRWGNPVQHSRQPLEDITGRPADAAMWGMQRIAMPIAAFGLGNAATKALGLGWKAGSRIGASFGGGLAEGFGAMAPVNASTGAAMGLRDVWGAARAGYATGGFEGAAAAFEGISAGGAANLAFRGIAGSALGLASATVMGFGIGTALTKVAEKGIFEPYVNTRRLSRDLRDTHAGITFGDARGNVVSGRGLGMQESYRMASEINRQGALDMTYSTGEYAQGASMIMRSGLTDNIGAKGISGRIKEVMEQVKMIQAIASMPELKEAIAEISKLNNMGASVTGGLNSNAMTTYSKLGMFASVAGTSVQRMMDTVGAQGQYLYQANGMTPYMGQLAMAGVYSTLASGQRMGVMSQAQIAKMGGIEGGAQGSLTGQINAMQTTFSKMALFNQAHGGQGFGKGGNAVNVISDFNRRMVQDPLGTYGAMELFSSELAGQELTSKGSKAVQEQLSALIAGQPGVLDSRGKLSYEKAVPYLQQMGFSMDQIKDYYNQLSSEQDNGAFGQRMKAVGAQTSEQYRQYLSTNKLYAGVLGTTIYNVNKGWRAGMAAGSDMVGSGLDKLGLGGDTLHKFADRMVYGSEISHVDRTSIDEMMGGKLSTTATNVDLFNLSSLSKEVGAEGWEHFNMKKPGQIRDAKVMNEINELAKNKDAFGHDEAVELLQNKDPASKLSNLEKVLGFTSYKRDYLGNESRQIGNMKSLSDAIDSVGRTATDISKKPKIDHAEAWESTKIMFGRDVDSKFYDEDDKSENYYQKLTKMSGRVTNKEDAEENERLAGYASNIFLKYKSVGEFSAARAKGEDEDIKRYDAAIGDNKGNLKGRMRDEDIYDKILNAAIYTKKLGGSEFSMEMSGSLLDKEGNELTGKARYEKALSLTGSRFKNAMANANDVSRDEVRGAVAIDKNAAETSSVLTEQHREGILDVSGYQQQMMQVESNKLLSKIEENTKKMADQATNRAPSDGGTTQSDPETPNLFSMAGWRKLTGQQRITTPAGNK